MEAESGPAEHVRFHGRDHRLPPHLHLAGIHECPVDDFGLPKHCRGLALWYFSRSPCWLSGILRILRGLLCSSLDDLQEVAPSRTSGVVSQGDAFLFFKNYSQYSLLLPCLPSTPGRGLSTACWSGGRRSSQQTP